MASHNTNERSNSVDKRDHNRDDGNNVQSNEPEFGTNLPFDRRSVLKLTGVAAAATTGFTGTVAAGTSQHGIQFDNVADAVGDLGMDNTGQTPIDNALESGLTSGTLIEFPAGTYLVSNTHYLDGLSRIGLVGKTGNRRDVKLTPPAGEHSAIFGSAGGSVNQFLLKDLSFDDRDDNSTMAAISLRTTGDSLVKNVEWLGKTPREEGKSFQFNAEATTQSSVLTIDGVYAGLDIPAPFQEYPNGINFIRGGPAHRGEVVLKNSVIRNRPSCATRWTGGSGIATIRNCKFANNQNGSIRFGAGSHPDKKSSAENCYIRYDEAIPSTGEAIRIGGTPSPHETGAVLRNIQVDWLAGDARGILSLVDFSPHGSVLVDQCVWRNESSRCPNIYAGSPEGGSENAIVVQNSHFTGSGNGDFIAVNRPGSVVRDCCVDMPDVNYRGFETQNVSTSGCKDTGDQIDDGSDETSDESTTLLDHELVINGTGTSTNFEVSVSDEIRAHPTVGSFPDGSYESITTQTANGWVTQPSHTDAFTFAGQIESFEILQGGPLDITLDGQSVTVDELTNQQPTAAVTVTEKDGLTVTLSGTESTDSDGEVVAYEWDIQGTLYTGQKVAHTFESPGTYDVKLTVEDDTGITETTTSEVSVQFPNELRIQGTGVSTQYSLEIDGEFQPKEDTVEQWDSISNTGATGWVTSTTDVDAFTYDGEVTNVEFIDGDADVYINGEEIDPSAIGLPNSIAIDGRSVDGDSTYSLSVTGDLASTTESDATVSGSSAEGVVGNDVHRYRFSGNLMSLSVDGNASISFEDTDG